jgi:hypothetical protein
VRLMPRCSGRPYSGVSVRALSAGQQLSAALEGHPLNLNSGAHSRLWNHYEPAKGGPTRCRLR